MNEQAMVEDRLVRIRVALEGAGAVLSRYGLVVILLLIGILKFTPADVAGDEQFRGRDAGGELALPRR